MSKYFVVASLDRTLKKNLKYQHNIGILLKLNKR